MAKVSAHFDNAKTVKAGTKKRLAPKSKVSQKQYEAMKRIARSETLRMAETKHTDNAGSAVPVSSTPVLVPITTGIVAGTGKGSRIGEDIIPAYFSCRFKINGNSSGAFINQAYRILLVRWWDNYSENTPTQEDIFGAATDIFAHYDTEEAASYHVLMDRRGILAKSIDNADHSQYFDVSFSMKDMPGKTVFDSSGNPTSGHLFLLFLSDETTTGPTLGWSYRFAFKDI